MDVLVLDMTHGGDILSREMKEEGASVTCADIYGIATQELKSELMQEGIGVCGRPHGRYDLVLAPVHCPDSYLDDVEYSERKDFHHAVGERVRDGGFRIEVTGEKGKTGLCYFLAHVLHCAGRRVLLHTSRSREYWDEYGSHLYPGKYSIAPTSLLTLPDTDADMTIAEVSLGGSGKADISVITNLRNDYPIAAGTRKASQGKASILNPFGINIVPEDEFEFWSSFSDNLSCVRRRVTLDRSAPLGSPRCMEFEFDGRRRAVLQPGYLHNSYQETFDIGLEVLSRIGLSPDEVIKGLQSFKGVPGRGEIVENEGTTFVIERNPGISADSITHTLRSLSDCTDLSRTTIVIDPVNRKVCDKLDTERIDRILEDEGLTAIWEEGIGTEKLMERHHGNGTVVLFIKEGYQ